MTVATMNVKAPSVSIPPSPTELRIARERDRIGKPQKEAPKCPQRIRRCPARISNAASKRVAGSSLRRGPLATPRRASKRVPGHPRAFVESRFVTSSQKSPIALSQWTRTRKTTGPPRRCTAWWNDKPQPRFPEDFPAFPGRFEPESRCAEGPRESWPLMSASAS